MSEVTIYANAVGGYGPSMAGMDLTYSTARSTCYTIFNDTAVGQSLEESYYICREAALEFDTHLLADCTISAATLSMCFAYDLTSTDFTIEARLVDWGTGYPQLTTFIAGADLSGAALLASYNTSSGITTGTTYHDFSSEAALASNVDKSGMTQMLLTSSRHRVGNTPTGVEYLYPRQYGETTYLPKLVITYTGQLRTDGTGAVRAGSPALLGTGTGAAYSVAGCGLQIGSAFLHGADFYGTGALSTTGFSLSGVGHQHITAVGACIIASPTLSGRAWLDSSAHRQLTGTAMLNGIRGKVDLYGIKGRIEV